MTTTLAGGTASFGSLNGVGTNAGFMYPNAIAFSAFTNSVIVADSLNQVIRSVSVETQEVTTIAGDLVNAYPMNSGYLDGAGTTAQFMFPGAVVYDSVSETVLVGDSPQEGNGALRAYSYQSGMVTTLSMNGGGSYGAMAINEEAREVYAWWPNYDAECDCSAPSIRTTSFADVLFPGPTAAPTAEPTAESVSESESESESESSYGSSYGDDAVIDAGGKPVSFVAAGLCAVLLAARY